MSPAKPFEMHLLRISLFSFGYLGVVLVNAMEKDVDVVIGSKDQYGGESLLKTSKNSIIYVRSNYRVRTSTVEVTDESSERLDSCRDRPFWRLEEQRMPASSIRSQR